MSTTTTDDLEAMTDAQLNELFAVEYAGWEWQDGNAPSMFPPRWRMPDGMWTRELVFCTDLNAVLPWLEKYEFVSIDRVKGAGWQVAILHHKELDSGGYEEGIIAKAWEDTLPRAGVIALLKAKREVG